MKSLDLLNTKLAGSNLIEANAGTGKTYAISGLFVRLILEKGLSVDQILVVTFTTAATEELKEKIRGALLQAKNAFSGDAGADLFWQNLVNKYSNPSAAIPLLQDALTAFDRAAIFTIHGFCQRILHENAFETGSLFDTELETDPGGLTQEIADDFWRTHFCTAPPEVIRYSMTKIPGPEYFFNLLSKIRAPAIRIVPEPKRPEFENLVPFRRIFNQLRDRWPESRETVRQLLSDAPLNGSIYGTLKPDPRRPEFTKRTLKVLSLIEAMDRFVAGNNTGFPLFKGFEMFTATKLNQSVKKDHDPPCHAFFEICDRLNAVAAELETEMERNILHLKSAFIHYAKKELPVRKQQLNIKFFDDLLVTVRNALAEPGGNALSRAIRKKYRAALVDEFQDTDSVQYAIFNRLFNTDETVFFMIGDPKQAIYSFRGADIFSYMTAARRATKKHTLAKNWRSDPGLITAVNTLFSNVKAPFVFDEIVFEQSRPAKHDETAVGTPDAPMKLWFVRSKENNRPLPKSEAVEMIAAAVAGEISRLVAPDAGKVAVGDIAVLVRTNRQAQIVKNALSLKKIPSVLYNTGNVFHSHEALEMQRILSSISDPGSEHRMRAALATDLLGVSGETLYLSRKDPGWWESRLSDFRDYFRLWTLHGFIRMFRLFMAKEKVRRRLLAFPDGERRLTNVLHLAELIHQRSIEKDPGISGLLKWLAEQRNTAIPESEAHQLRLESDALAVKIITIHKSKGLEYPVVFCPYGWEGSVLKEDEVLFHDTDAEARLTLDIGSNHIDRHLTIARNELLAENLRLLYVALTRAKSRCYLSWGRINTAETSAMAYLLYGDVVSERFDNGRDDAKADLVTALKNIFSEKNDDDLFSDMKRLADSSMGTIELLFLPDANDAPFMQKEIPEQRFCRTFSGRIGRKWKVSSYSALVSRRPGDIELPDRDAFSTGHRGYPTAATDDPELTDPEGVTADIFSFPKGTRAGIFFHELFEQLDFTSSDTDYPGTLVAEKLASHGFDPSWKDAVCGMIENVISTPLFRDNKDLVLASVEHGERVTEMAFYFPLKTITPSKLKNIFLSHGAGEIPLEYSDRLGKLIFAPTEGFMKGYIDMIFHANGRYYLVDWKSNFLGADKENYSRTSLESVMREHDYMLQYCLYSLALHLHLRRRIPNYRYEKDFGGVVYIFIRGVTQRDGPEYGIYSDVPGANFMRALERGLVPGE